MFLLSFGPSQMISGPENSMEFLRKMYKCLPLCIIQFQIEFLDASADCVEWQWFSKVVLSPCGYVHNGGMTVYQTILLRPNLSLNPVGPQPKTNGHYTNIQNQNPQKHFTKESKGNKTPNETYKQNTLKYKGVKTNKNAVWKRHLHKKKSLPHTAEASGFMPVARLAILHIISN